MALKTKSVWTSIDAKRDGLRILATRSHGTLLPKTRYDAWMPNLGPSEKLLGDLLGERISWTQFVRGYKMELISDAGPNPKNDRQRSHGQKPTLHLIKVLAKRSNVTLLCHCDEDEKRCHRHALQRLILSSKF